MPARTCAEFHRTLSRPDRRSFVKAGILGTAGLGLADVLRAQAPVAPTPGSLSNVTFHGRKR